MQRPYRIIYALSLALEGGATAMLPLDRRGQAAPSRSNDAKNGMPHWPKKRTIDLRVGDKVYWRGSWHVILKIRAVREAWLTAEEAAACREGGYIYRPLPEAIALSRRRGLEG
jgi:hypothetical protein